METTYTPDFTVIKEALTQTWPLGTEWLIPLVIAFLVMAVITRDTDKWKILALPIFVLERIIGIPIHFVLMSIAGIIFVIEALSTQVVGNLIGTVKKWTTEAEDGIARESKIFKQLQRAEQHERKMSKLSLDKIYGTFGKGTYKRELKRRKPDGDLFK